LIYLGGPYQSKKHLVGLINQKSTGLVDHHGALFLPVASSAVSYYFFQKVTNWNAAGTASEKEHFRSST
jgi:hypothetical protein